MFPERQRRGSSHSISREKAVSREKAQNAQKKESFLLTETLTEWVTTVSTPSFSFCAFCAFSWPSIAVFRINNLLGGAMSCSGHLVRAFGPHFVFRFVTWGFAPGWFEDAPLALTQEI